MELHVVIHNENTLTWKYESLIPIEWYDYIEMIYDIMNENRMKCNEMDLMNHIIDIHNILYSGSYWIWKNRYSYAVVDLKCYKWILRTTVVFGICHPTVYFQNQNI